MKTNEAYKIITKSNNFVFAVKKRKRAEICQKYQKGNHEKFGFNESEEKQKSYEDI